MARWKLLQPHYLNVPGTEWEYRETNRTTGRPERKTFPVPLYLNPEDPGDCNHRDGEEPILVVSNGGTRDPKDYMFTGLPTPDMKPMDDEAEVITAELTPSWSHAINDLPNTQGNYSQSLVDNLEKKMSEAQAKQASPQVEGMSDLLATMKEMMVQNQAVLATLAQTRVGVAGGDVRKL